MNEVDIYLQYSRIYVDAEDEFIELAFDQLCKYILSLNDKKNNIDVKIINSKTLRHEVIHTETNRHTIIWDVGYWDFFKDFISSFYSINNLLRLRDENTDNSVYIKMIDEIISCSISSFVSNSFFYLSRRYHLCNDTAAMIFAKESVKKGFHIYGNTRMLESEYEPIIKIAKIYALTHELEHILSRICPEIRKNDGEVFKLSLERIINNDLFAFDNDEINAIKGMIYGENNEIFEETYSDVHSFFEVFSFVAWQQQKTEKEYFSKYPDFSICIKLLRVFDTFYKGLFNITDGLINSVTTLSETELNKKAKDFNDNYILRDTLCEKIELDQMLLKAKNYNIDLDNFYANFDHSKEMRAYNDILGKYFNAILNRVKYLIDFENYHMKNKIIEKSQFTEFLFE